MPHPRAAVHCFLQRDETVLLLRTVDSVTGEVAWRAPGGGIEFCETSVEAVRREIREEVGVELARWELLEVFETISFWSGKEEHEIVFFFEGAPTDWALIAGDVIAGVEANGEPLDLRWVTVAEIVEAGEKFYPEGIVPHLLRNQTR